LLEALDSKDCPLHEPLGAPEIRAQLGLAKDYRNAWKGADEKATLLSGTSDNVNPRKNMSLQDLQLESMLRALVLGCEQAHGLVQHHHVTVNSNNLASGDVQPQHGVDSSMETDDQPFEYMDDAMDLD